MFITTLKHLIAAWIARQIAEANRHEAIYRREMGIQEND